MSSLSENGLISLNSENHSVTLKKSSSLVHHSLDSKVPPALNQPIKTSISPSVMFLRLQSKEFLEKKSEDLFNSYMKPTESSLNSKLDLLRLRVRMDKLNPLNFQLEKHLMLMLLFLELEWLQIPISLMV